MIIGHIPAGYIVSRLLLPRLAMGRLDPKWLLCAGVLGAIAPDLDMLYFHLVDHRMHHHHTYVTHFPIVWGSLLLASAVWWGFFRGDRAALLTIFTLNGFIHMLLDSIVGDIWWLAPFLDQPFALFTVPALYQPWWLNFILHWSFALEVAVLIWAIWLWRRGHHDPARYGRPLFLHREVPSASKRLGSARREQLRRVRYAPPRRGLSGK